MVLSRLLAVLGLLLALCLPACEAVVLQPLDDSGRSSAAQPRAATQSNDCIDYIVQLEDPPAVAWAAKLNTKSSSSSSGRDHPVSAATLASPAVTQYAARLKGQADAVATKALGGTSRINAYYQFAFSGMSVKCVSAQELLVLKKDPRVAAVTPNSFAQPATISTPHFLGLDAAGGIWSQLGGVSNAGDGIVIAVMDGGFWPESPSFSDQLDPNSNSGGSVYEPLPGFAGTCDSGSEPAATMCNRKVLSCRHFIQGTADSEEALLRKYPYEYLNCRDANYHGSHTASTAAGNFGASTDLNTTATMSGVAPRARLAIYKVCWGRAPDVCPAAATLAGVEAAMLDGVHIISYSLSADATDNLEHPVQQAFMNAAAAGIFVAAAGGNSDSGNVVQHPGPWVTTVAASSQARVLSASVTVGDDAGTKFSGAGLLEPSPLAPLPLILSDNAGLVGANPDDLRFCINGTLDPEKVRGKVVVCDRGGRINPRYLKSRVVAAAQGVAMILVNTPQTANTVVGTDHHAVPTVHLPVAARDALRAYAAAAGTKATAVLASVMTSDATAPQMASFSLQGPSPAARSELLKPDLTAPGVDILAAVSPPGNLGFKTDFYSGTSMATPHVSGAAALLKSLHREWSPMMIKSALMTTAYQTNKLGQPVGTPFSMGAGHIEPTAAVNPGLVFDSSLRDWQRAVCGSQSSTVKWADLCPECLEDPGLCEPQQLNAASVAAANVVWQARITRTVTSVLSEVADFTLLSITKPAGFDVSVTPAAFTLQPGDSATLEIAITHLDAPLGVYSSGAIAWASSQGTVTRIPVVARAADAAASRPVEKRFASPNRPRRLRYSVQTAYAGSFSTLAIGLQPPRVISGSVSQDPDKKFVVSDTAGTTAVRVSVSPGSLWSYVRLSLFNSDFPTAAQGVDLDLHVYDNRGKRVASSTNGGSDEQVNISMPNSTSYTVYIHAFNLAQLQGPVDFKLYVWVLRLPSPGSSNARSAPSAASPVMVSPGSEVNVSVAFSDRLLQPTHKWLGAVLYGGANSGMGAVPEMTLVSLV